jgi:hypothetical protein
MFDDPYLHPMIDGVGVFFSYHLNSNGGQISKSIRALCLANDLHTWEALTQWTLDNYNTTVQYTPPLKVRITFPNYETYVQFKLAWL